MLRIHKYIFYILLFLLLCAGALIFFLNKDDTIVNYPPRGTHIVVLGDSLSAGVGASSPEKGYVALLEKRLGVPIVNKGVSGDTTRQGLARYETDITPAKPDILILLLGGNDYLQKIPIDETFANLRAIILRAQKEGAVVLLVGIRGGLLSDHFDDRFSALADVTGSVYVPDVLDGLFGHAELMADPIHPNDAGYTHISDRLEPVLRDLLSGYSKTN